ncbi:GAF and ANTAR domain-containing protein [Amycolatopsis alkalitolerans]|uniref:ANTAR domain-containing protein n=1 Tax=Amycolatopsis alkalitolerans TaxID=2547244 RepID=A0A5C4M957_9PSEU|nr:GAF and ANTAR domain-containing protein [Amycolatopsis alkalitolerans]TNC29108.1 ANTAR domain-containing protein [Amycolatopsis alkalitolerans]
MSDTARLPIRFVEAMAALAENIVLDDEPVRRAELVAGHAKDLLEVDAAAVLLDDGAGGVPDGPAMRRLLHLLPKEGPALHSRQSGRPVRLADVSASAPRWPAFTAAALAGGFTSVDAIPLHCNDIIEGGLIVFRSRPGPLTAEQDATARSLGIHAATLLSLTRDLDQQKRLSAQLEGALSSRVDIEQAKGILAARHRMTPDQAFAALRAYARRHNRRLHDLAREVVSGRFDLPGPGPVASERYLKRS